jgi:hypothetical protein
MVQDETIVLKAEIFDIIQMQEEKTAIANSLQQVKLQKLQELKSIGQETQTIAENYSDNIIKIKAEIFDIMQEQEGYIAMVNEHQQAKAQKLQKLKTIRNGQ